MKVSFIGGGKMAEAIIASLLKAKIASPAEVSVSDVSEERRKALKKDYGVNTYANNSLVTGASNVVFLAVKPQQLNEVLAEIATSITREHLLISIAAGMRLAKIEACVPTARVVRVMPNIACLVSEAMSVFTLGSRAVEADRFMARKLFSSVGKAIELSEELFDIVTALSGSGPAFFAYLLSKMVDEAVSQGLPREEALLLAKQTMLGTARLLLDRLPDPDELIRAVTSARGTTAEGLTILEGSPVAEIIKETLRAAARRSRELSQGQ